MNMRKVKIGILSTIDLPTLNDDPRLLLFEKRNYSFKTLPHDIHIDTEYLGDKTFGVTVTDKLYIEKSLPVLGLLDNYKIGIFGVGFEPQPDKQGVAYCGGAWCNRYLALDSNGEFYSSSSKEYKPLESDKMVERVVLRVAAKHHFNDQSTEGILRKYLERHS